MWFVNAIYGSALKMTEIKEGKQDRDAAYNRLKAIQRRVKVMDKSGRASVTTFENGIGDALLTYENEAMLRQKQGKQFPFIVPQCTILIENPIAVVDRNAKWPKRSSSLSWSAKPNGVLPDSALGRWMKLC